MKALFEDGVLQIFSNESGVLAFESLMHDNTISANGIRIRTNQIQEIILHPGFTVIIDAIIASNVKRVYIPDGVIEFKHSAYNCRNLEEISFPSSLQILGASSLSSCPNLRKVEFRGGFNKDIKIENSVLDFVFNIQNAEQLLDMDTEDEIKAFIFNKHFSLEEMKRMVLVSYLNGKPASGKFEQAIIRYAKKSRDDTFKYILRHKDIDTIEAFIKLFFKGKDTLKDLDYFLEEASKANAVEVERVVSRLKSEHFSDTDIKKNNDDTKLKKLGLKDLSVADYKKIYTLKDTPNGYIITQYKGEATDVVIPEMIGNKPVIAIKRGVFQDKSITSIESPVSPSPADFFGMSVYPQIHVYGHIPLKKKVRLTSLEKADVNNFVLFGSYPAEKEDGNLQPIVWRVLEKTDSEMLLISRFVIETLPMHTERTKISWDNCELRRWLNQFFYHFAFNEEEKQKIVKVKNMDITNPKYPQNAGRSTEDYVYLAKLEDAEKYESAFRNAENTEYVPMIRGLSFHWYSSNGRYSTYFSCNKFGVCNYEGQPCDEIGEIQPMIRIRL